MGAWPLLHVTGHGVSARPLPPFPKALAMRIVPLALAAALVADLAGAGATVRARGFSLECPDGWRAVRSIGEARELAREAPALAADLATVDFRHTALLLIEPTRKEGVFARIDAAATSGASPLEPEPRKQLLAALAAEMIRPTDVAEIPVGPHRALSLRWTIDALLREDKLEDYQLTRHVRVAQWQVYIPVGDRVHVLTCTAGAEGFGEREALFRAVVQSFRAGEERPPAARRRSLPWPWTAAAAAAALACVAVAIVRRRRRAACP